VAFAVPSPHAKPYGHTVSVGVDEPATSHAYPAVQLLQLRAPPAALLRL
jgi:hypothetical protein